MIYAAPSTTENSFLDGAPTGLAASLKWKLLEADGTVSIAEVTGTGISEIDTGIYRKSFTVPDDQGDFIIVWTNGSTRVTEELVVTSSAVTFAAPTGSDLTTLASVRAFMQKIADDTEQDDLISSMISSASLAVMRWAGREFAPATDGLTRTFSYDGDGLLNLVPYDLRSVTAIVSDPAGVATALTTPTDYLLRPRNPENGVYSHLLLPNRWSLPFSTERDIAITGNWGFASIPADVQHACNVTIKWWIENDVSAFSSGFDANTDQFTRGEALPQGVRRMLAPYRRITVG